MYLHGSALPLSPTMYWECRCKADGDCNCADNGEGPSYGGHLAGFWGDLWAFGQQAIDAEADRRSGSSGQEAHIAAQNEAVREFESEALAPYRQGIITIEQARQMIQAINAGFTAYCRRLGYARALQGAADVDRLAQQLIADLGGYQPVPALPGGGGYGSGFFDSMGTTGSSIVPLALGFGALYFLMGSRRRR